MDFAVSNNYDITKLLIDYGADVNYINKDCNTVLMSVMDVKIDINAWIITETPRIHTLIFVVILCHQRLLK